jgi:uncharacterized protein YbjT (DUF2867 family)
MKMVVIGGTSLIGSQVASNLRRQGHEVAMASSRPGVAPNHREDLARVLSGSRVVIDVASFPAYEETAVQSAVQTSTRHLLAAASAVGVQHVVALSVVGSERLAGSDHFRARLTQEHLVRASGIPCTIVRATQVFESLGGIADAATDGKGVHLAPAFVQPMAAKDVAAGVTRATLWAPVDGVVEIAGPEAFRLDELVRDYLRAHNDPRVVITDPYARFFGASLHVCTLVPGENARLGGIHFADWLPQANLPHRQSLAPLPYCSHR